MRRGRISFPARHWACRNVIPFNTPYKRTIPNAIASKAIIMKQKSDSQQSYLIVSASCFGASAIYHLKRELPPAQVTLLDPISFPNPSVAGHDLNKIIRANNQDIFYMTPAIEALEPGEYPMRSVMRAVCYTPKRRECFEPIWTILMPSVKTKC